MRQNLDGLKSYLSHLECTACGRTFSAAEVHTVCPACGKVLFARYDLAAAKAGFDRDALARRPGGMWRWFEFLPVLDEANVVTLGEGGTPLLRAVGIEKQLHARNIYIKEEGLNPTGSFK